MADRSLGQKRQRGSHHGSGDKEEKEGEGKLQKAKSEELRLELLPDRSIQRIDRLEAHRKQDRRACNGQLQQGIGGQRTSDAG